jgi:hypothetical protein
MIVKQCLFWIGLAASVFAPAYSYEPGGEATGAAIVADYKIELQAALGKGLAKGVLEAVSACKIEAPDIADGLSTEGIRVGRTSQRLREPTNTAPDWVAPILQSYLADPLELSAIEIPLTDGRMGYVEPIIMQPMCSLCHGVNIAPDVRAKIDTLYPEDQAVGFQVGELRGVFWVEYPTGSGF